MYVCNKKRIHFINHRGNIIHPTFEFHYFKLFIESLKGFLLNSQNQKPTQ